MATLIISFGIATCVKFISEYLGIIEGADSNTQKLRHEPLISALSWLYNANNCKNKDMMQTYLHDARREFMKAVSLEEDENKITALLGLAMCQQMFGDKINAQNNLARIKDVSLSAGAIARANAKYIVCPPILREVLIAKTTKTRYKDFNHFQAEALRFNTKLLALK